MSKNTICNNCGKQGHLFNQCKIPITSYGIIVFRTSIMYDIQYCKPFLDQIYYSNDFYIYPLIYLVF